MNYRRKPKRQPISERLADLLKPGAVTTLAYLKIYLKMKTVASVLFVDESSCCQNFLTNNPWISKNTPIIYPDDEIASEFAINKFPTLVFIWKGKEEIGRLEGVLSFPQARKCPDHYVLLKEPKSLNEEEESSHEDN